MFFKNQFFVKFLNVPIFSVKRNLSNRKQTAAKKLPSFSEFPHIKPIIGLEIHVQLNCSTKLFSRALANDSFDAPSNTRCAMFDIATPGTLPLLNKKAVELSILAAILLDCNIQQFCRFDRKHYFYPDLPHGYQITQKYHPIALNGHFDFYACYMEEYDDFQHMSNSYKKRLNIERIQLEMDSGRVIRHGNQELVDYNRAGLPLIEIVTLPELCSPSENFLSLRCKVTANKTKIGNYLVVSFVEQLRLILIENGITQGDMHKGQFRVDTNVSLTVHGEKGARTEIKNISHLGNLFNAISQELDRQFHVVLKGGKVIEETRNIDESGSVSAREKGEGFDYRFIPETNLPRLQIKPQWINKAGKAAIFPVSSILQRLIDSHGFPPEFALFVTHDKRFLDFVFRCLFHSLTYMDLKTWLFELELLSRKIPGMQFPPSNECARWFTECFADAISYHSSGLITKLTCLDLLKNIVQEAVTERSSKLPMPSLKEKIESEDIWRIISPNDVYTIVRDVCLSPTNIEQSKLLTISGESNKKYRAHMRLRKACVIASRRRLSIEDIDDSINIVVLSLKMVN